MSIYINGHGNHTNSCRSVELSSFFSDNVVHYCVFTVIKLQNMQTRHSQCYRTSAEALLAILALPSESDDIELDRSDGEA